jgi:hypothetical protein
VWLAFRGWRSTRYSLRTAINEIHNVSEVPKSLQRQWTARSNHGDVQNNSRTGRTRYDPPAPVAEEGGLAPSGARRSIRGRRA